VSTDTERRMTTMRNARSETDSFFSTLLRISFATVFWSSFLMLLCLPSSAAVIYVPADHSTIQGAIDSASSGDVIIVSPGRYPEHVNFTGKSVTLRSTDPADPHVVENTIIDGDTDNDGVGDGTAVGFAGTEGEACVLSGFTITNGFGAGIRGNGTLATIEHNVISGNTGTTGGGVEDCDGIVQDNVVSGNQGDSGGGLGKCDGTVQRNTVTENSATSGGGLWRCDGTIQENTVSANSAYVGAGLSQCNGTIQNNTISGNWGADLGGGVEDCDGLIQNNVIVDNTARDYGGGLHLCDGIIQNNIVWLNVVSLGNGGGLTWCNGTVQNNTIWANSANAGGGLFGCQGTVRNCIVWQNTATSGAQLHECVTPTYSCIQGWSGGGEGNISENPLLLDPVGGDLRLHPDSPCVDAGRYVADLTEDFEGDPRGYDGTPEPRGDGMDFDIGADEYVPTGPVAEFSGAPTSGPVPLAVQFTDLSAGEITSWWWSFGDGTTSTEQNPSHTYNSAGYFTVSLTVDGPEGSDTETKTDYINVTVAPPVAGFSAVPTSGHRPLVVEFTDESTGEITSWSWDFGDGGTSTLQNPSHTYETAGYFTVSLTVSGPGGSDTETKTNYISVTELAPVAGFSASPRSGGTPLEVQFTDESTGTVTSWSWDFGDGGTSTQQNPSHTYNSTGYFTVTLTVSGPGGSDTETKAGYIHATEAAPVADFTASPGSGSLPLTVRFTDQSSGAVTSWSWTFGDGATSTARSPLHTYISAGSFTVSLTVAGPGGSDVETKTNYIRVWAKEDVDQDGDVDEADARMILEVAVGLSSHTGCDLNGDREVNAMDAIVCLKAAH